MSGQLSFDIESERINYTIDIYKLALGHSLTNVEYLSYLNLFSLKSHKNIT